MSSAAVDINGIRPERNTIVSMPRDVTEYGLRRVLIVAAVMASALMQTLDSTITNVALPTIQGNLGASQDEATWVITAYTIAAIIVIPLTPWLQDRFGRKSYFVASIIGFTLASVACGSSTNLNALIFMRVIQGAFGGGLLATAQTILRDTFPPEQLGRSQGIFAIGAIMGPALGPTLGGILVDNWTWNWCFYINVFFGSFAAAVLFLLLRDPQGRRTSPIDIVGLALLALGLGSMQYVLTEGEQNYWFQDTTIVIMTFVCVVSLGAFVMNEVRFTKTPAVDLTILKNRSVSAGTIIAFAMGVTILGSTYAIPQFTQGPLGFTATLSGLLFLLRAVPILLATIPVVSLAARVDARIPLAAGFAILALANTMLAFAMTPQSSFWTLAPSQVLSGIGAALVFIPLSIAVLGATTRSEGPKATAFINLAVQLGGSISVALLDVLLAQREQFHSSILAANVVLSRPVIQQFVEAHPIAQLAQDVYLQSAVLSYADVTLAIAVVAAICVPLVFLMRPRKKSTSASRPSVAEAIPSH
jgi:DHA2 family multidrug resistance protein